MPTPESTSAEAFEHYVGGTGIKAPRGKAWRDAKAFILAPPKAMETMLLPSVSEPFLAWTVKGEIDFEEREGAGP